MGLWEQHISLDVEISTHDVTGRAKRLEEEGRPEFNSMLWMTAGKGKNLPMTLGKWLASKCGAVIGGRRFVAGRRTDGVATYRL